jgi:hypothetical protein
LIRGVVYKPWHDALLSRNLARQVEALPPLRHYATKGVSLAAMGALGVWWAQNVLPKDKIAYNMTNAYFGIVPLLVYIFVRRPTDCCAAARFFPSFDHTARAE